jgi:uncharacterized protein (TIGR02147 family)
VNADLYSHASYKTYLKAIESQDARGGRGFRSRIAQALRCNIAYISQVLNQNAQLGLEQAEELNAFLGHSGEESEFFLLLVQFERAGSVKLSSRLKTQIDKRRGERLLLRNRVDIKQSLSPASQIQYYSSWEYSAVHVALTVPELSSVESISKELGIPRQRVAEVLEFLDQVGLAKRKNGKFNVGEGRIFLKSDSPMVWKHHTNWRLRAIHSYQEARADRLHLSTVFSASHADIERMKKALLDCIEDVRGRIKDSKEETVHCLNVDFFDL